MPEWRPAAKQMIDKYVDLPREVRIFLETISPSELGQIQAAIDFYDRLPQYSKEFLLAARPATLEWLRDARKEEVDQFVYASRLAHASTTVGKFLMWALITLSGAILAVATVVNFLRGKWQ
jgi:hypothetical protein